MKCACAQETLGKPMALCDLHAREFQNRIERLTGYAKVWNDALDAAEDRLEARGGRSPISVWISDTFQKLRKADG